MRPIVEIDPLIVLGYVLSIAMLILELTYSIYKDRKTGR